MPGGEFFRIEIVDLDGAVGGFVGYAQKPGFVLGKDARRHRVDDAASYFTVLLVGHLVLAPILLIETLWMMPLWQSLAIVLPVMIGVLMLPAAVRVVRTVTPAFHHGG